MNNFTIVPLDTKHIDEICNDIKYQIDNKIADCALFRFQLHPEGTPPADKAGIQIRKYILFRDKLRKMDLRSGILVQSSIGHGYPLSEDSPFKKYVNLNNGKTETVCCPSDPDFCNYIRSAFAKLASTEPDVIMVDDDFRLIFRPGNGCACQMHMGEFNRLSGLELTRQELFEKLKEDGSGNIAKMYLQTQHTSLINAAKAMREGIDSVDPSIPGIYCAAGYNMESALDIATIIAGKGNPVKVRISNGAYVPPGARFISFNFYRGAKQIAYIRDKVDTILAECDTIPWNQYAISVQWFHSHFTGSILEGTSGSKRWITRLNDYEPESGVPYRKLLSENSGFYEKLTELVPTLKWTGCRIPLSDTPVFSFSENGWNSSSDGGDGWSTYLLERLGIPVYYSTLPGGAVFLSAKADIKFSDSEIAEMFRGTVVMSSDSAIRLQERGFGKLLGAKVEKWNGSMPNAERISATGRLCDAQFDAHKLVPENDSVITDSMIYHTVDDENYTPLFPGTTVFSNELGGKSVVFSGTPVTEMNYTDAFSFLNYSRKQQFIKLLKDELPVYYEGTEEMYMKAAYMLDGGIFCALFNLGFDPVYKIPIATGLKVSSVKWLTPNGEFSDCEFSETETGISIKKPIYTLHPMILKLN